MASDRDERIARVLARYPGEEHAELRALIAERVADFDARLGQRDSLIATLTGRLGMLESAVEGLQRAGKRQAAPFAKRAPKANPRSRAASPGRATAPRPIGRFRSASPTVLHANRDGRSVLSSTCTPPTAPPVTTISMRVRSRWPTHHGITTSATCHTGSA